MVIPCEILDDARPEWRFRTRLSAMPSQNRDSASGGDRKLPRSGPRDTDGRGARFGNAPVEVEIPDKLKMPYGLGDFGDSRGLAAKRLKEETAKHTSRRPTTHAHWIVPMRT